MKKAASRFWKYIEGANGFILILYTVFIFSTYAFVVTHQVVSWFKWTVLIIILAILICPQILKWVRKIHIRQPRKDGKSSHNFAWLLLFFLIPLILFFAKYIIYYPGAFSPDSLTQYQQALTGSYNDWHPVIQTLLSIKLPLVLTGGWIGSITLFQIICFSVILAYALYTIRKHTNNRYAILAMLFIMLNPQTTNMAMFPWKDVSFAMGALLLVTYALRIYFTSGDWIKRPLNLIAFIITAALTTLVRHNALLFTIPLFIAIAFLINWKRALIVCAGAIILIAAIKIPLYSALHVEKPDKRQIETLGLPMNIIGSVATYFPEQLDDETRSFIYQVAPEEVWEEKYTYGNYNSVKWDDRTNNDIIEEYGAARVLSMTLRCLKTSPTTSMRGLIRLTDAVYTISDDYIYYDVPGIHDNEYGITQQGISKLQEVNDRLTYRINRWLPWIFMYIGSMHLVLLISALAKCRLNKWKDWKKILLILPVFLYNFGTALLLTSASDSSRFFYYTFLILPVLLVFLYKKDDERSPEDTIRKAS